MGTNVPQGRQAILTWVEGLLPQWGTNQAAIGLTSAQVIQLGTEAANARQSFTVVQEYRENSKAKTQTFYAKADAVHTSASNAVTAIKAFAQNSGDPSAVYELAGITGKNPPSPAPAPGTPTGITASLNGAGAITISFDATGPTGTVWQVTRKLAGETSFTYIGYADVETKSFSDPAVTPGTASVQYIVQGIRGTTAGQPSGALAVYLGNADGEAATEAA